MNEKVTTQKQAKMLIEDFVLSLLDEWDTKKFENWESHGGAFEQIVYRTRGLIPEGSITQFHQEGGKGKGDFYQIIYEVTVKGYNPFLISFEGSYDSWEGVDWDFSDSFTLVEPVQVLVTQYKRIEGS